MNLPLWFQEYICYVVMEGELRERGEEGKGVGEKEITVIAIDVFKKHKLRRKLDCLKEMENNKGKQRNLG